MRNAIRPASACVGSSVAKLLPRASVTRMSRVSKFLRVKNNYNKSFDPNISYGYRALLGNLKFESGQTVGSVFL